MAVRRKETGNNPLAMRIPDFRCRKAHRRISGGNGSQFALVVDDQVSNERLLLPGRHCDEASIGHNELRGQSRHCALCCE